MLNKNTEHTAPQTVLDRICKNCVNSESTIFPDLIRCKRDKSSVTRCAGGTCALFEKRSVSSQGSSPCLSTPAYTKKEEKINV
ncbi:MAG: hypothetical protein NC191_10010 [Muribaculaceae bacterium]|nr:hypothetical protein [Muribaculaceae bacterium]